MSNLLTPVNPDFGYNKYNLHLKKGFNMVLLAVLILQLAILSSASRSDDLTPLENDVIERGPGMCVTYGLCQLKDGLPCVNNTAAQPVPEDETVRERLYKLCPHLR